jgi:hypothetical protein
MNHPGGRKFFPVLCVVAGLAGWLLSFWFGSKGSVWTALLVCTAVIIGIGISGVMISVIFQLTNARFGRSYRRIAESFIMLTPLGIVGIIILLLGVDHYIPWIHNHHLTGGKQLWLTRGFWSFRVVTALTVSYGSALIFLYYSLRQDFCVPQITNKYDNPISRFVSRNIVNPETERLICQHRLSVWATITAVVYAVAFSLLGFDLIMSLEPEWYSTLFGAWYFIGHIFTGLALLLLVSIPLRKQKPFCDHLSDVHQSDLATLLFAFCLVNADFFWSQYLTIWYGNLPEETGYIITRCLDTHRPYRVFSRISLLAFFAIPFIALLFRKIKSSHIAAGCVAAITVIGVVLARFLEIAPPLLNLPSGTSVMDLSLPIISTFLLLAACLGLGWCGHRWFLRQVPGMPVGDIIFQAECSRKADQS